MLGCTLGSPLARAQVSANAADDYDALIKQATAAYGNQRFEQARDLFERAHALRPSARTLRGLGIAALALNRYTEAQPELEAALADPRKPLTRDQRREVSDILGWMKESLGTFRLALSPPHALALVDDRAVSAGRNLLELGEHRLLVRAAGYQTREQTFALERDLPLELHIDLMPEPPEPAPSISPPEVALTATSSVPATSRDQAEPDSTSVFGRWWFWTLAGVVVAGTVAAVVAATHEPSPKSLPQGIEVTTQ